MAFGDLIKKLFGGGAARGEAAAAAPDRSQAVEYKGFVIIPAPRPHGGQYLTAALIEKEDAGGAKRVHELVRADTHASPDAAGSFAIQKARQVIDEQGERIFAQG
jgi:hypothetical protein